MCKREENVVLLNPSHFPYRADLEKTYDEVDPGADHGTLAKKPFDEEYQFNAGKYVILAIQGPAELGEREMAGGRQLRQNLNSRKMAV